MSESCDLHDPDSLRDEDEPCPECYLALLEYENEQLKERAMELFRQDKELASQRRTIATLRVRLSYRKGRIPPPGNEHEARWIRERFDILSDFNQVAKYSEGLSQLGWHWLRKQNAKRIAAIRNFGALP